MEPVLWTSFSSSVMVPDVTDITINRLEVFGSDFLSGALAMRADLHLFLWSVNKDVLLTVKSWRASDSSTKVLPVSFLASRKILWS